MKKIYIWLIIVLISTFVVLSVQYQSYNVITDQFDLVVDSNFSGSSLYADNINISGKAIFNQSLLINAPVQCSDGYKSVFTNLSQQICTAVDYAPGNLNISKNLSVSDNLIVDGIVTFYDEENKTRHLGNMATHISEMQSDTLLDASRSTLTTLNGVVNFTLYAKNNIGQWNFNGTVYGGNLSVSQASIILYNGSNTNPATNYIYFYLDSGVPRLNTSLIYPTVLHIDVATFVIGEVVDNTSTIYGYNRNRYEIDSFVKRNLEWHEARGTLYVNGFSTKSSTTTLNISTGTWFGNNIFQMYSTNNVTIADGFYYINSTGQFIQCTSLTNLTQYNDGTAFSGVNERVNIIWGIIAINTTGGVEPTQARLVAVLPNYPGAGNTYQSIANAIADNFDTLSYYPPNTDIRNGFVPIARTILRPNADVNEPFVTNVYHKFLAGTVGTGGGSPSVGVTDHSVLDNLDFRVAGHYGNLTMSGNLNMSYYNITEVKTLSTNVVNGSEVIYTRFWTLNDNLNSTRFGNIITNGDVSSRNMTVTENLTVLGEINGEKIKYVTTNISTNLTTKIQLTELNFTLLANKIYVIECKINTETGQTANATRLVFNFTTNPTSINHQCTTFTSGTATFTASSKSNNLDCASTASVGNNLPTHFYYNAELLVGGSNIIFTPFMYGETNTKTFYTTYKYSSCTFKRIN